MSREIALMPATELLRRYRDRSLSPVEATKAALARIAALNETLNAYCLVDDERALAAARASEARWQKGTPRRPDRRRAGLDQGPASSPTAGRRGAASHAIDPNRSVGRRMRR